MCRTVYVSSVVKSITTCRADKRTLILNNTCGRNSFFYLKIVQCLVAMYVLSDQLKQKNEEDNRTIKDYISRRSIY